MSAPRLVAGLHPVRELVRAGGSVHEILVARDRGDGEIDELVSLAEGSRVPVRRVDGDEIEELTPDVVHQGVVARAPEFGYQRLRDLLERVVDPALLVALDHVTDPRNLGAVARSAEAVGADALLIPGRRAAGVTTVAEKAAAGALAHLPVVREANLATALRTCRDAGLWIVGLAGDGETPLYDCPLLTEPLVLVAGAEGAGLARLSRVVCDQVVSLPQRGRVGSLNVAVAAAVALYETLRRRTVDV